MGWCHSVCAELVLHGGDVISQDPWQVSDAEASDVRSGHPLSVLAVS